MRENIFFVQVSSTKDTDNVGVLEAFKQVLEDNGILVGSEKSIGPHYTFVETPDFNLESLFEKTKDAGLQVDKKPEFHHTPSSNHPNIYTVILQR